MKNQSVQKSEIFQKELNDWNRNATFHSEDEVKPYRLWFWEIVISEFNLHSNNKSLLEVGSGSGVLSSMLKKYGHSVHGVDFSEKMIQLSKIRYPGILFQVASADLLPYTSNKFNGCIATMLLHHLAVQNLDARGLKEMDRVLKKGGSIYILDHSGNLASGLTLNFFNFLKKIFSIIKGNFASSGSSNEINYNTFERVKEILHSYKEIKRVYKFTILFQLMSSISHGTSYMFGSTISIQFEKKTLPLVKFFERVFEKIPFLCTECIYVLQK